LRRHGEGRAPASRLRRARTRRQGASRRRQDRQARRRERAADRDGRDPAGDARDLLTRMVVAIVLAAGEATRDGRPKQRKPPPATLAALERSPVDEVVVVSGAHTLEPDERARFVQAPDWDRGPGASLRRGLAALDERVEHALVVLADGPDLDPRAVER